jgi:transposase-like protein
MENKKIRRVHTPSFKSQVVLALLRGEKTRGEIASEFGIHPTQADKWKQKFMEGIGQIFSEGVKDEAKERDKLIEELYKQIGQLKVESDWLKKKMGLISR